MGGMSWGALTHVTKVHSKWPGSAVFDSIWSCPSPIAISHWIEPRRAQRLSDYHMSHCANNHSMRVVIGVYLSSFHTP